MKAIGEKISKRKPTNSVLSCDDVLNDRNDCLADKNGENDEISYNFGTMQ